MSEAFSTVNPKCPICSKSFCTKYTLQKHLKGVHHQGVNHQSGGGGQMRSDDSMDQVLSCTATRCRFTTTFAGDLKRHIEKCSFVAMDREIQHMQEELHKLGEEKSEMAKQLNEIMSENTRLRAQNDCNAAFIEHLQDKLSKSEDTITELAKRPTTIDNSVHHQTQNNQTNHNHITNILCDRATSEALLDPARIHAIAWKEMEPYFWQGQSGAANFVSEHLIKTEDNKMVIVCTDYERKRFKCMSQDNKVVEDIQAVEFTKQIAAPIKTACNELHGKIVAELEQQQKSSQVGSFEKFHTEKKREQADQMMLEINCIDDERNNNVFKRELSRVLKV